jgi:diacylglycerol kinase (ATP)
MNDIPATPKIGVLINAHSGRNRTGTQALDAALAVRPEIPVQRPAQADETASALAALATQGVNVLAVCGGDGTVQEVLNVLLSPQTPFAKMPVLAILPGGTTNMIAHDVNETSRPAKVLEAVLRHIDGGTLAARLTHRPVMRLTGGDAKAPAHGFFFGAAGIYEATLQNRDSVDKVGLRDGFGPGLRLLDVLFKIATGRDPFVPVPMAITLDGTVYGEKPVEALLVSSLQKLSLGFVPFWGAGRGGLRLTMVFSHSKALLRAIWLALRSRAHPLLQPENGYDSGNFQRIELAFDGGCVLDGETFHALRTQPILLQNITELAFIRG